MIGSIDKFLDRVPTSKYNCLDFVREVWKEWTGQDITDSLTRLVGDFGDRKATLSGIRSFTALQAPASPCFIVMQRKNMEPHIGLYLGRRILHLGPRGVEFQPLIVAKAYFTSFRYYK